MSGENDDYFNNRCITRVRRRLLVMSENYIKNNFDRIKKYASIIENRIDDGWCTMESVLKDNAHFFKSAKKYNANIIFIDDSYEADIDVIQTYEGQMD